MEDAKLAAIAADFGLETPAVSQGIEFELNKVENLQHPGKAVKCVGRKEAYLASGKRVIQRCSQLSKADRRAVGMFKQDER